VSVAQDDNLRKSIKNHALKELKLLDSIRTAREIERKTISFTRRTDLMVEETGISSSISDEDIKQYLVLRLCPVATDEDVYRTSEKLRAFVIPKKIFLLS